MSWREWKSDPIYYAREFTLAVFAFSLFGLTCVATPIYILHGCYRLHVPSDVVHARVENVQPNVDFLCVVADSDEGPQPLHWYMTHLFGRFTMHSSAHNVTFAGSGGGTPSIVSHDVRWVSAKRYGVLTREHGHVWRLYWFSTDEAKERNGTWTAVLPDKDKGETPSGEFLKQIGIAPDEVQ
jgi:hypothetical protein